MGENDGNDEIGKRIGQEKMFRALRGMGFYAKSKVSQLKDTATKEKFLEKLSEFTKVIDSISGHIPPSLDITIGMELTLSFKAIGLYPKVPKYYIRSNYLMDKFIRYVQSFKKPKL